MTESEVALAWQELRFRLACAEKTGIEFQSLFEGIMEKVDSSFIKVKPSGAAGDWKCDGVLPGSGTYFQVYAPEGLTVAETKSKIQSDLAGLLTKWGDKVQAWVFVWSAATFGLPAEIVNLLQDLRAAHPTLRIEDWGREDLWREVRSLSELDRAALFGTAPALGAVTNTTAAEVQVLLNYLVDQPTPQLDDDLGYVTLEEKMDRNGFSDAVRLVIKAGFPIVHAVEHYVSNHPDTRYSQRVAVALSDVYEQNKVAIGDDASAVFAALVGSLAEATQPVDREYWAAVAVIAYYFELCDIFER